MMTKEEVAQVIAYCDEKMVDACKAQGVAEPEYEEKGGFVKIVFRKADTNQGLSWDEVGSKLGLIMMRDLKYYLPDEKDFHFVKLMVDRMERVESELEKIKSL